MPEKRPDRDVPPAELYSGEEPSTDQPINAPERRSTLKPLLWTLAILGAFVVIYVLALAYLIE